MLKQKTIQNKQEYKGSQLFCMVASRGCGEILSDGVPNKQIKNISIEENEYALTVSACLKNECYITTHISKTARKETLQKASS